MPRPDIQCPCGANVRKVTIQNLRSSDRCTSHPTAFLRPSNNASGPSRATVSEFFTCLPCMLSFLSSPTDSSEATPTTPLSKLVRYFLYCPGFILIPCTVYEVCHSWSIFHRLSATQD